MTCRRYCLCYCHWNLLSSIPPWDVLKQYSAWSFGESRLGKRAVRSEYHPLFHSQLMALEIQFPRPFFHFVYPLLEEVLTPFNDDARKSCSRAKIPIKLFDKSVSYSVISLCTSSFRRRWSYASPQSSEIGRKTDASEV